MGRLNRKVSSKKQAKTRAPVPAILWDRVELWIDAHPEGTAGDLVEAFKEFRSPADYFAFRKSGIDPAPHRG